MTHYKAASKTKEAGIKTLAAFPAWDYPALAQQMVSHAAQFHSPETSDNPPISKAGQLYLVGTPIGHRGDITLRALLTLAHVDAVLCEDTRVTGALLHSYGINRPLLSYHEHNAVAREAEVLERLQNCEQLALVSDAGMPLIADPGLRLVQACQQQGLAVTVCPGASAVITALSLSGLSPLPFLFGGFLPPKSTARRKALVIWQSTSAALVFYETPPRLVASLHDMVAVLGDRAAAIGRELTKKFEECRHGTLSELAEHYTVHPPRGEIVVMIAPPPEAIQPGETALQDALVEAMAHHSLRDAVALVCQNSGVARDIIYALALDIKHRNVP